MSAQLKPKLAKKHKKCKSCEGYFVQWNSTQVVCSPQCAQNYSRAQMVKKLKRQKRDGRVKLRTVRDWIALAQAEVNRFIRLRDAFDGCISCHMPENYGGQWHASHYMPAGNNSAIRFDEANINKGCAQCNTHKSGNRGPYRVQLIAKIGLAEVERLEGPQPLKRYDIPELIGIRDAYRAKTKHLKFQRANAASFA